MSENQPNYFAIIPANVRYCKNLEPAAKLLYGEITALTHKEGYCWASNAYFSRLYEVDQRTITRWLSSLEKEGFIKIETTKTDLKWDRKIYISQEMFTKGQKCPIENHTEKKPSTDSFERTDKNVLIERTKMSTEVIHDLKEQVIDDTRTREDLLFFKSKDASRSAIAMSRSKLFSDLHASDCSDCEIEEAIRRLQVANPALLPGSVLKYLQKIITTIRKEKIQETKTQTYKEKKHEPYQAITGAKSGIRKNGIFQESKENKTRTA